jgi:hypothetical protein
VPNHDAIDCGVLAVAASLEARTKAQRCVLDALAAGRAFKLIDWLQDNENGRGALAYAWTGASQRVSVFDYTSNGPMYPQAELRGNATLGETVCRTLETKSNCQVTPTDLCLECVDLVESSLECSRPARGTPGKCLGPGNYGRGKGYNPGFCCPGLREVMQQVPSYSGEDLEPICSFAIQPSFACIEGRCGDGRCEDAEAVRCGCPLDCPSAVFGNDADAGA